MQENENVEFKIEYNENIYKEIIAFLNSYSGTIFKVHTLEMGLVQYLQLKKLLNK